MRRKTLPLLALVAIAALSLSAQPGRPFLTRYLVSDGPLEASHVDGRLVNAWGLAASATSPWWVANNGSSTSTLYDGDGNPVPLVVSTVGSPTGIVFNGGPGFVITDGVSSGPARFLFAAEGGWIEGWNPAVPPPAPSTSTRIAVDNGPSGAIYKGLAIASTAEGDRLYATDFHNGKVDVFDGAFQPVADPGAFVDPGIPAGFAPFGIQNVNGRIVVTYARQDQEAVDDVRGQGLGFVSVFEPDGTFLARVGTRGRLNAPWGVALAPAGFGEAGGHLLVGNFGDGRINLFEMSDDMRRFTPRGQLRGPDQKPIEIDGLWGIGFGNGAASGPTNALYFAAGPIDEEHGSFGRIDPE